jgi:hypothetical protein
MVSLFHTNSPIYQPELAVWNMFQEQSRTLHLLCPRGRCRSKALSHLTFHKCAALISRVAIVTKQRSNDNRGHETVDQTQELFRILIPHGDVTLREALHVLDPEGNTLVYNIAVRGFDSLLEYVLSLETLARRMAMVNACTRGPDGNEKSVYQAVIEKLRELNHRIRLNRYTEDVRIKAFLVDQGTRLTNCKHILLRAGAVAHPNQKQRWRISA